MGHRPFSVILRCLATRAFEGRNRPSSTLWGITHADRDHRRVRVSRAAGRAEAARRRQRAWSRSTSWCCSTTRRRSCRCPTTSGSGSSPATSPTAPPCRLIVQGTDRCSISPPSSAPGRGRLRSRLPGQSRRHARRARRVPRLGQPAAAGLHQLAGGLWRRLPPAVGDDTALTPQTSYGAQKAIGELLVNDYTRKGFVDGRALRLPTIWCARAGPTGPPRPWPRR